MAVTSFPIVPEKVIAVINKVVRRRVGPAELAGIEHSRVFIYLLDVIRTLAHGFIAADDSAPPSIQAAALADRIVWNSATVGGHACAGCLMNFFVPIDLKDRGRSAAHELVPPILLSVARLREIPTTRHKTTVVQAQRQGRPTTRLPKPGDCAPKSDEREKRSSIKAKGLVCHPKCSGFSGA